MTVIYNTLKLFFRILDRDIMIARDSQGSCILLLHNFQHLEQFYQKPMDSNPLLEEGVFVLSSAIGRADV